jgi:hypothetical protein
VAADRRGADRRDRVYLVAACGGRRVRTTSSGAASTIHGMPPNLTWASCTRQSMVLDRRWPRSISQATAPSSVHGVCQVVLLIMSGQMILRPAPHMPVNSRQRSQNPSRAATRSLIGKPQVGQASTLETRAGTSRGRRSLPSLRGSGAPARASLSLPAPRRLSWTVADHLGLRDICPASRSVCLRLRQVKACRAATTGGAESAACPVPSPQPLTQMLTARRRTQSITFSD